MIIIILEIEMSNIYHAAHDYSRSNDPYYLSVITLLNIQCFDRNYAPFRTAVHMDVI